MFFVGHCHRIRAHFAKVEAAPGGPVHNRKLANLHLVQPHHEFHSVVVPGFLVKLAKHVATKLHRA